MKTFLIPTALLLIFLVHNKKNKKISQIVTEQNRTEKAEQSREDIFFWLLFLGVN